jgi:hypothetical protein
MDGDIGTGSPGIGRLLPLCWGVSPTRRATYKGYDCAECGTTERYDPLDGLAIGEWNIFTLSYLSSRRGSAVKFRELIERVLARASRAALARAILKAAQTEHPARRITLRRGARLIADTTE